MLTAVRATRAVLPDMTRQQRGVVVFVGSDAGELAPPGFAPYAVSKAALMNLSKLVSKEFGRFGVRANLVAAGLTRTHATKDLLDDLADKHGSETAGIRELTQDLRMALPRFGTAEEVAALIVYLAGDHALQITGAPSG